MKSIFVKKNIALIIIALFIFSSVVGASSLQNEILINPYENTYFIRHIKTDEFVENFLDILGNQPPDTPDINGPTIGKPGVELDYTIVSTDPEENDIVYCFDWGDDTGELCIGPFPSGEEVIISHTWEENGTYTITVKASDILGEESGLATLKVKISTSRISPNFRILLFEIFQVLKKIKSNILDFYQ